MAIRFNILVAAYLCVMLTAASAHADEAAGPRAQLDKILAVLRVRTQAASKACLTAMTQVHETEQQVKNHENDSGNHPDLDIARDVLDSDYQNSSQLCGADADRACRENPGADVSRLCLALHRDGS